MSSTNTSLNNRVGLLSSIIPTYPTPVLLSAKELRRLIAIPLFSSLLEGAQRHV